MLKSFAITVEELEGALKDGVGFDDSSIEGFARIDESDMVALHDPDTFRLLPWRPKEPAQQVEQLTPKHLQGRAGYLILYLIKRAGAEYEQSHKR